MGRHTEASTTKTLPKKTLFIDLIFGQGWKLEANGSLTVVTV